MNPFKQPITFSAIALSIITFAPQYSIASTYTPAALCEVLADMSTDAHDLKSMGAPINRAKGSYDILRKAQGQKKVDGLISLYDQVVDESYSSNESSTKLKTRIYDNCMRQQYTEQQVKTGDGMPGLFD